MIYKVSRLNANFEYVDINKCSSCAFRSVFWLKNRLNKLHKLRKYMFYVWTSASFVEFWPCPVPHWISLGSAPDINSSIINSKGLLSTWRPHRKLADNLAHDVPLSETFAYYLFCALNVNHTMLRLGTSVNYMLSFVIHFISLFRLSCFFTESNYP